MNFLKGQNVLIVFFSIVSAICNGQVSVADTTYDSLGHITSIKFSADHQATFTYYKKGRPKSIFHQYVQHSSNGQLMEAYVDSSFYPSGQLETITTERNDTLYQVYYESNGKIKTNITQLLVRSEKNPRYEFEGYSSYFFDGLIQERHFYHAGALRMKELYDPKERLFEKRQYFPEQNEMTVAYYDILGHTSESYAYKDNKPAGETVQYFSNGMPSMIIKYEAGLIVSVKTYLPDGQVIGKTNVEGGKGKVFIAIENGEICCECEVKNGKMGECKDLIKDKKHNPIRGIF
jgi:antitoxin component YwqK of YwqJK toxin-antitoxin module